MIRLSIQQVSDRTRATKSHKKSKKISLTMKTLRHHCLQMKLLISRCKIKGIFQSQFSLRQSHRPLSSQRTLIISKKIQLLTQVVFQAALDLSELSHTRATKRQSSIRPTNFKNKSKAPQMPSLGTILVVKKPRQSWRSLGAMKRLMKSTKWHD